MDVEVTKPAETRQAQPAKKIPDSVRITGKQAKKICGILPLLHTGTLGASSLTLAAIIDAADTNGRSTWKSVATLAALAGISERTCRRHLRELEAGLFLESIKRGRTSTIKRLTRHKAELLGARFWPLPKWATDRGLSWSARATLGFLVFYCGDNSDTIKSAEQIAAELGLAGRSVKRALKELTAAGLIRRTERVRNDWVTELLAPAELADRIVSLPTAEADRAPISGVLGHEHVSTVRAEAQESGSKNDRAEAHEAEKSKGQNDRAEGDNLTEEPKGLLTQDTNTTAFNHFYAGGRGVQKSKTGKKWRVDWIEDRDVDSPIKLGLLLKKLTASGVIRTTTQENNFWATATRAAWGAVRPGAMLASWVAKPESAPLEYLTDTDDDWAKHLQADWRAVRGAANVADVDDDVVDLWADLILAGVVVRASTDGATLEIKGDRKRLDQATATRLRELHGELLALLVEYEPPDRRRLPQRPPRAPRRTETEQTYHATAN